LSKLAIPRSTCFTERKEKKFKKVYNTIITAAAVAGAVWNENSAHGLFSSTTSVHTLTSTSFNSISGRRGDELMHP